MEEISSLARPDIYAMKPYSSARTEGSQHARIYLDANENPYPPYPATDRQAGYNRYPEPQPSGLLSRFADLYGVEPDHLFLSRGADEAIDLLVRAFCAAGRDGVLLTTPTFVMYETAARIQGARIHRVPLLGIGREGTRSASEGGSASNGRSASGESPAVSRDGAEPASCGDVTRVRLDVEGMLAVQAADPAIKLVFVCSPNNPLGMLMDTGDVLRLADALFGRALVLVDELYVDYSGRPSLAGVVAEHPNLVVLRSVSKEYSLAGERCGITVAHPEVIGILTRIMAPYSLAVSAIRAVEMAVSPEGIAHGRAIIAGLVAERERVRTALAVSPAVQRIFPSDANFLLVVTKDARLLVKVMETAGIKIRDRSGVVDNSVRISIGTPAENDEMLEVFADYEHMVTDPA
jgi:histidinol-phosphate aminotransferase